MLGGFPSGQSVTFANCPSVRVVLVNGTDVEISCEPSATGHCGCGSLGGVQLASDGFPIKSCPQYSHAPSNDAPSRVVTLFSCAPGR